jgi:hypothetical protein
VQRHAVVGAQGGQRLQAIAGEHQLQVVLPHEGAGDRLVDLAVEQPAAVGGRWRVSDHRVQIAAGTRSTHQEVRDHRLQHWDTLIGGGGCGAIDRCERQATLEQPQALAQELDLAPADDCEGLVVGQDRQQRLLLLA